MRLALFISSLHTGGAQRQIVALAAGLHNHGRQSQLICVYPGGQFWQDAELSGVRLQALFDQRPRSRLGRALGVLWSPVRLRRKIRDNQVDVLYSMLDLSNLIARLALVGTRKKPMLAWGIRSTIYHADFRAVIPFHLCRLLSGSVPAVISNSRKALKEHRAAGFRFGEGHVVYNGIDHSRFRKDAEGRQQLRVQWGLSGDTAVVALVGRLHPRKGHELFLQAAAALCGRRDDLQFVVVGPDPDGLQPRLERLAHDLVIETRLRFTGPVDDMPAVYSAADVVVSCSSGEGLPNVVAEAMSCSTPCVVTDVGESASLVGDCGPVVPPNDAVALANAIVLALERRDELGPCGRQRIMAEFSIESMVQHTLQVIDECRSKSLT